MPPPCPRAGLPLVLPGMVIGLLGGSFDPAHAGHATITRTALRGFGLDQVWWLVSPGNPLKTEGPASMSRRIAQARQVMRHPRVHVTDIETRLGTRYTADTLTALCRRHPGVRFVWLMGSDNLASFHLWRDWQRIALNVPIGVLARPGSRLQARLSPAARWMARWRLPLEASSLLGRSDAPAWCMLDLPLDPSSSSAIRRRGEWQR